MFLAKLAYLLFSDLKVEIFEMENINIAAKVKEFRGLINVSQFQKW